MISKYRNNHFILFIGFLLFSSVSDANLLLHMEAKAVAKNIYAVLTPSRDLPNTTNRGWNSNSAFIVTQSGVIVFDTGSSLEIGNALKNTIKKITPLPVRWIINSHSHGDHWLGNAAFKDSVETIYATEEVANNIKGNGQNWIERFNQMTEGITGDTQILLPNTFIKQTTKLNLDNINITLFLSGNSHSPGDILLWMPDEQVLIAGDVIYSDRMPSTQDSHLLNWIQFLGKLEAMKPKVVIPGHGSVTNLKGISQLKNLLHTLWTSVELEYENGLADFEMVEKVLEALETFKPQYPGLTEKIKRDLSSVFIQVESASF